MLFTDACWLDLTMQALNDRTQAAYLGRWFLFRSCIVIWHSALLAALASKKRVVFAVTGLLLRVVVGFSQKVTILGFFNVLGSWWILITSLAWRQGGRLAQYVADLSRHCVCCSVRKMSSHCTSSVAGGCGFATDLSVCPQKVSQPVTSLKPGGRAQLPHLSFHAVMVTTSAVFYLFYCTNNHLLSWLRSKCHPFSLSQIYRD